jgi:ketosteroid isomerase-like protein
VTDTADLVRRAYEAFAKRDLEAMAEVAVADFELDVTDRVLNPATYRGEDGLRQFFCEIDELWESMDMKVERLVERGDDEVLALLSVAIKGRGSGLQLQDRIAQRWEARDGKLVRMQVRSDPAAALAEFEGG